MTKDEIRARIEGLRAELDGPDSSTAEGGEPALDAASRREHLEREIAGLEAMLAEG